MTSNNALRTIQSNDEKTQVYYIIIRGGLEVVGRASRLCYAFFFSRGLDGVQVAACGCLGSRF